MARFYFHLNDGHDVLIDSEGVELPDRAAAARRALDSARDILSAEIREGRVPLDMHLAVEDERGLTIHLLPFAQAVQITMPPSAEG